MALTKGRGAFAPLDHHTAQDYGSVKMVERFMVTPLWGVRDK